MAAKMLLDPRVARELEGTVWMECVLAGFTRKLSSYPRWKDIMTFYVPAVAHKWEKVACSMGLEGELKILQRDNPKDCQACAMRVVMMWLSREEDRYHTWKNLFLHSR